MNAQQWVADYARLLGLPSPDEPTSEVLLEIAAVAAHDSERIAAPIACYLVGVAGLDPAAALEVARRVTG